MIPAIARLKAKWRWIAAVVLVLPAAYLASEGPARYAARREWMASRWVNVGFNPAKVVRHLPLIGPLRSAYVGWWKRLGRRHNPPYAIRRAIGNFDVDVASDDYTVTAVEEERHEIFIANRFRIAVDGDRVFIADWTTELMKLREIVRSPKRHTKLSIKYFDDVLEVEANGERVRLNPIPRLAN